MPTQSTRLSMDEVADRGTVIYETKLRPLVETGNIGRILAIDVESGDYAIADERADAVKVLRDKNCNAQIWVLRIGPVAVARITGYKVLQTKLTSRPDAGTKP